MNGTALAWALQLASRSWLQVRTSVNEHIRQSDRRIHAVGRCLGFCKKSDYRCVQRGVIVKRTITQREFHDPYR